MRHVKETMSGIALETLSEEYYRAERAAAVLAVALYCLGIIALLGAGVLCAVCLRGCAAETAPAFAAAEVYAGGCLAENIRLGIYGDEMCGFITEER